MVSRQPSFDTIVERDVRVSMRDKTVLFADVYHPRAEGRYPSILVRTSYNKDAADSSIDPYYFASRGYGVVIQDVRGRYKSGGDYYHGISEVEDGYDTVEWVASQSWCNGMVGMTGISYLAAVQCAAAISGTPHLLSLFHTKAPADYYQNGYRRGGAFLMYHIPIILMFATSGREAQGDTVLMKALEDAYSNAPDWMRSWPPKRGQTILSRTPWLEDWLFDMMNHGDYDEFWKRVPLWQVVEHFDKFGPIAAHFLGGWYDKYNESPLYTGLSKRKMKSLKLLMGPWTHLDTNRYAGDVDFGEDAAMTYSQYLELQLGWFDSTIGGGTGMKQPPVKIFVMGGGTGRKTVEGRLDHGGRWRYENEWPLARAKNASYYLRSGGLLTAEADMVDSSSTSYVYDPKNPVPTIGGTSYFTQMLPMGQGINPKALEKGVPRSRMRIFVPFGAHDQRERAEYFGCSRNLPLSFRHDVLVFQTAPLVESTEVTGTAYVRLYASSSAIDTDFTARLIDVYPPNEDYPDGYAMNLTDSVIRARYRNGFQKSELMNPGEVYEFVINLPPTSNLFATGHRIRLDVSSSNFPQFDPNPNTGELYMQGGRCVIAVNTVYHDKVRPSCVSLPIIPNL